MQVYEDVIQKHCHARMQNIGKLVVNGLHEDGRCVCKPYRYYYPFIRTISHIESGLWDGFVSNTTLPLPTAKINRCEVLHTSHLVQ